MVRAADGSRQRIGRRRRCGDQPSGRAGETEGGRALRPVQRPLCAVAVGRVRGGTAPRQPLPGTREAWPQRVSWLSRLSGRNHPPTRGNLGRQNRHTLQSGDRFRRCQPRKRTGCPKGSSVVRKADRPLAAASSIASRETTIRGTTAVTRHASPGRWWGRGLPSVALSPLRRCPQISIFLGHHWYLLQHHTSTVET